MPTHADLPYLKEFHESGAHKMEFIRNAIAVMNRIIETHVEEAFDLEDSKLATIPMVQVLVDTLGADYDHRYANDHFIFRKLPGEYDSYLYEVVGRHPNAVKFLEWIKHRQSVGMKVDFIVGEMQ